MWRILNGEIKNSMQDLEKYSAPDLVKGIWRINLAEIKLRNLRRMIQFATDFSDFQIVSHN